MRNSSRRRTGGLISAVAVTAAILAAVAVPSMAGAAPVPDPSNTNPTVDVSAPVTDPTPTATLSGESLMAQQMTVATTGWPADTTLSYQWLRDGEPIDGATSASYFPGFADYRAVLTVTVSGTGSWGSKQVVSDGSAPITSEDDATIVIGALTPADGLVEGATVHLSTDDRLLQATATTSARGVAIFQGLPAAPHYTYTLFQDGSFRAMGQQIEVRADDETLRRVVITPALQKDSSLEGVFAGSTGSLGVFAGTKAFRLGGDLADGMRDDNRLDDTPMTSAEIRLSVTDGENQRVELSRNGSDWTGILDLDRTPQLAALGVYRNYQGGEQYATFIDLAVVAPATVTDRRGEPLSGVDVVLESSASPDGPFAPVASDDLHYATDRNPVSTDAEGRFGFLVIDPRQWFRATVTVDGVTVSSAVVQGQFAAGALSIVVDRAAVTGPSAARLAATGPDSGSWPLGGLLLLAGAALIVARRAGRRA